MDSGTTVDKVSFGRVFCSAAIMAVIVLIRRILTLCAVLPSIIDPSPLFLLVPPLRQYRANNRARTPASRLSSVPSPSPTSSRRP